MMFGVCDKWYVMEGVDMDTDDVGSVCSNTG